MRMSLGFPACFFSSFIASIWIFFYFGRITAPRSQNTNAGIDYAPRDQIYQGKYDELFLGKGFFYLDYAYDKSHGIIERDPY